MFTGIIEGRGRVTELRPVAAGMRLVIEAPQWGYLAAPGDSIAVNGCCLTQASAEAPGRFAFDVIPETLSRTNLGGLTPGAVVNLEHAATASTLLGGHVVQGHIDAVAEVVGIETSGEWRVRLAADPGAMEYLVPKGCVALDGVSLTLARVDPASRTFEVALIPTTLDKTNLGDLRVGSRCNVETDVLTRTVVHWLRNYRDAPR
ncbi:MAG: riboflavin synthase [Phycisphaerales bacterium]